MFDSTVDFEGLLTQKTGNKPNLAATDIHTPTISKSAMAQGLFDVVFPPSQRISHKARKTIRNRYLESLIRLEDEGIFNPKLLPLTQRFIYFWFKHKQQERKKLSLSERVYRQCANARHARPNVILVDNICEPETNIEDNFTFFKFLYAQKDPNFVPYYVLHKKSPYYQALKSQYGAQILGYGGKRDYIFKQRFIRILWHTKLIFESFLALGKISKHFLEIIRDSRQITSVFTQHGITFFKPEFIRPVSYGAKKFNKVMISNDIEAEIFTQRGGFLPEDLLRNGLFRWDHLLEPAQKPVRKSILIFFTKRGYLTKSEDIGQSSYFRQITDLISSPELHRLLKEKNIVLKIARHHTLPSLLFRQSDIGAAEFVSEDGVFEAKREASLLITDYSSMCFEFFLQNKPVIFYPIRDEAECRAFGAKEDVADPFSDKENLFENIVRTKQELVAKVADYVASDFELTPSEQTKQSAFFYYRDAFCQRLYTNLKKMDN